MRSWLWSIWSEVRTGASVLGLVLLAVFLLLGVIGFAEAACNGEPPIERVTRGGCEP